MLKIAFAGLFIIHRNMEIVKLYHLTCGMRTRSSRNQACILEVTHLNQELPSGRIWLERLLIFHWLFSFIEIWYVCIIYSCRIFCLLLFLNCMISQINVKCVAGANLQLPFALWSILVSFSPSFWIHGTQTHLWCSSAASVFPTKPLRAAPPNTADTGN